MRSDEAADRGIREDLSVVGLGAEQARDGDKGNSCANRQAQEMQATGDNDAVVRRQSGLPEYPLMLGAQKNPLGLGILGP